jgi:hypothetical protein
MKDKRKLKEIKINGIKTLVLIPRGINPKKFPKKIITGKKEIGGLVTYL